MREKHTHTKMISEAVGGQGKEEYFGKFSQKREH